MKSIQLVRRFTPDEWGGTETAVLSSAVEMVKRGDEPQIFCTAALSVPGEDSLSGVPVRRFDYFYPNFPMTRGRALCLDKKGGNPYAFTLFRALSDARTDLIHSHTMGRLALMGAKMACRQRIPFILSLHGGLLDVPVQEVTRMMSPLKGTFPYGSFLDRLFFRNRNVAEVADGIVCVGKKEARMISEKYPRKKVLVLENGVNPEMFCNGDGKAFRQMFNIAPDSTLFLCVSRLDPQKNQRLLFETVLEMRRSGRKVCAVVIGPPTDEAYAAALECLAAENPDVLKLIKGVPPGSALLKNAYAAADCFVLPSVHEPFGIVVLEAWSALLPVVVSSVGGLSDLVEEGVTGLRFESENGAGLRAALEQMMDDSQMRNRLGLNGLVLVEAQYRWSAVIGKLCAFYDELIAEKKHD